MTFDEAARVLGVRLDGLTDNDVRKAYSSALRVAHPDVGGGSGSEAANVSRLRTAKDTLMKLVAVADLLDGTCMECKGTGQVRGTLLNRVCPYCRGSGKDANLHRH